MQSNSISGSLLRFVLLITRGGKSQYRHTVTHSLLGAVQPALCCEQLDIGGAGNGESLNVIRQKDIYNIMAVPVAPRHITR
jgi:hypothetical protein